MRDTSITVIFHGMSDCTVLNQMETRGDSNFINEFDHQ